MYTLTRKSYKKVSKRIFYTRNFVDLILLINLEIIPQSQRVRDRNKKSSISHRGRSPLNQIIT